MNFVVAKADGITVLTIQAEVLSKRNRTSIARRLIAAADSTGPVVVDFNNVERFDCSGLSMIVYWMAESNRTGHSLVLCARSPKLRALIDLVRIPAFVPVVASLPEALRLCNAPPQRIATDSAMERPAALPARPRAAAASGV